MRDLRLSSLAPTEYGDSDSDGEDDNAIGSSLLGNKSGRTWDSHAGVWTDRLRAAKHHLLRRPPALARVLSLSPAQLAPVAFLLLLIIALLSISRIIYPPPLKPTGEFGVLTQACASNDWRPGLYVNCTLSMGLNNLRSELSQCLKFAFDAGAGLVPPLMVLRNQSTLSAWSTGNDGDLYASTDFYFDVDRLKTELGEWCPEMPVWEEGRPGDKVVVDDRPGEWEMHFGVGTYRKHVDGVLKKAHVAPWWWSESNPIVIREPLRPYATWDYRSQSAELTNAFFDLIHWAPRLQSIGDAVAGHELLKNGYIGVHLRLEKDVIPGWAGFETQTEAYARYINERDERVIFLACGDSSFKKPFTALFPQHTVVDKWDLLVNGTAERAAAEALTFDEMGVLDYIPMLNSSLVLGIGLSSFAYLLGVDRRARGAGHFADTLHMELFPPGSTMVGDARTLLLPPILPEYYDYFP